MTIKHTWICSMTSVQIFKNEKRQYKKFVVNLGTPQNFSAILHYKSYIMIIVKNCSFRSTCSQEPVCHFFSYVTGSAHKKISQN